VVRRLAFVAAVASVSATACALVLGIDDLPLRADRDAAPDTGPLTDAGADCAPDPRTGCACGTHDFCDDFDTDGEAPFARWDWGLPNPFTKQDASVVLDTGGLSAPFATRVAVDTDSGSAYATVFNQLDLEALHPGRAFDGVRYTFWLRIEALDIPYEAGPVPGEGTAYVGAILQLFGVPPKPGGAAILFGAGGVYLAVSTNVLDANGTAVHARLYDNTALKVASANWIPVEIVVAERAKAISLGYVECNDVDAGPGVGVAAATVLTQFRACLPLSDTFGGVGWAAKPVVGVGGGTFNAGSIRVRQDDVAVDFL
jgi:hypothetical protein